MPYRSKSAASDADRAPVDLCFIAAVESSVRRWPESWEKKEWPAPAVVEQCSIVKTSRDRPGERPEALRPSAGAGRLTL